MRYSPLVFLAVTLVLGGCAKSDYTLDLPNSPLSASFLRTESHFAIAASSDGTMYATFGPKGMGPTLEIHKSSDGALVNTLNIGDSQNTAFPVLFMKDNELLLAGYNDRSFVTINIRDGSIRLTGQKAQGNVAPVAFPPFGACNKDRSIVIIYSTKNTSDSPGQILTYTGAYFPGVEPLGFDTFGNAWAVQEGHTVEITPDGKLLLGVRPKYLVQDQSKELGQMHLAMTEQKVDRRGASAYADVIWLDHDKAAQDGHRSMVVTADTDIFDYGFLPKQDLIYVISPRGTTFFSLDHERSGWTHTITFDSGPKPK